MAGGRPTGTAGDTGDRQAICGRMWCGQGSGGAACGLGRGTAAQERRPYLTPGRRVTRRPAMRKAHYAVAGRDRMAKPDATRRGDGAKGSDGPAGRRGGADRRPPIWLDLVVRDFGPVARASIAIRPMTILVGPNNSGKTYVATILRSILTAQRDAAGRSRRMLAGSGPRPASAGCWPESTGKTRAGWP